MSSFRQWKIFNKVFTPEYKNNYAKSYGTNTFTISDIYIGSSKTNSFPFVKHETKTYEENGQRFFEFYVDDKLIKKVTYDIKNQKPIISKQERDEIQNAPIDAEDIVVAV